MLRMKQERLRRGWTQTAVAFHARLTAAEVSRIETGRLRPYPTQIARLAQVFGLDPAELLLDGLPDADPGTGAPGTAQAGE